MNTNIETTNTDTPSSTTKTTPLTIYTDGSCKRNPGAGGWGLVITDPSKGTQFRQWGHDPQTTNQQMEMMAAIRALKAIEKRDPTEVVIHSDSEYLVKGMTEWLPGWVAKNWKNSSRKPVKNRDLWEQLIALSEKHTVSWRHVKAHNGDPLNELADTLANIGAAGKNGHTVVDLQTSNPQGSETLHL